MNIRVAILDEESDKFSEVVDFVKSDHWHNFLSFDGDWISYKNPTIQDFFKEYYRISNNSKDWHDFDASTIPSISEMSNDNIVFTSVNFRVQNFGFSSFKIKDHTKSSFSKDMVNIVIFDTDFKCSYLVPNMALVSENYGKVMKLWTEYKRRSKLDSLV